MNFNKILDFLFPPKCISCGKIGQWICSNCYRKHFKRNGPECIFCRNKSKGFSTHTQCLKQAKIDRGVICWQYNNLAKKTMKIFKYQYRYAISNYLARKCSDIFSKHLSRKSILIPVPSHRKKVLDRGFNQSQLLAKKLGEILDIPVMEPLERFKDTAQHAGMNRQSRITDENPFKLKSQFKKKLKDNRLIIVDDVCTTGTTLFQCASQLSKANPKSISAIALFRGKKST